GTAVSLESGTVCDVAGNCTVSLSAGPYQIDSVAPVITLGVPENNGDYTLNAAMAASYGCTDGTSGVATCAGSVASGANFATSPVGLHTFTVNAADVAGNPAVVTNNYSVFDSVLYTFSGFFQPVDNLPTVNSVKAGSAIPVKFSLDGNQGLNIFAAGSPTSA